MLSEEYRKSVEGIDTQVRITLKRGGPPPASEIRNAHWECLDCKDSWKVPRELAPTKCREHSVGRDGKPTRKPGCGSMNIRRKENVSRDDSGQDLSQLIEDVLSGTPAYVSGVQLRPTIDWEMGENDEEAEVRPRQLAINGRHPAFRAADLLDGRETVEGTDFESLRAAGALTIHIINAASQAWGYWHYQRSKGFFEQFTSNYAALKEACIAHLATPRTEKATA